jgi:hypothetical protein
MLPSPCNVQHPTSQPRDPLRALCLLCLCLNATYTRCGTLSLTPFSNLYVSYLPLTFVADDIAMQTLPQRHKSTLDHLRVRAVVVLKLERFAPMDPGPTHTMSHNECINLFSQLPGYSEQMRPGSRALHFNEKTFHTRSSVVSNKGLSERTNTYSAGVSHAQATPGAVVQKAYLLRRASTRALINSICSFARGSPT